MRRILVATGGTLAAVLAVFLYPTSTGQSLATSVPSPATGTATDTESLPSTDDATSGTGSSESTDSGSAGSESSDSESASSEGSASSDSGADDSSSSRSGSSDAMDGMYSGTSTMRYGTVTVTITVQNGQITDAQATQDSADPKSQMISAQAIPTLNSEANSAQTASISLVSHATFTSQAYTQSLQSAIDQAFGA